MAFILAPTIAVGEPQAKDVRPDEQGGHYVYVDLDEFGGASICFRSSAEALALVHACQLAAARLAEAEAAEAIADNAAAVQEIATGGFDRRRAADALSGVLAKHTPKQAERAPLIDESMFAEIDRARVQAAREETL